MALIDYEFQTEAEDKLTELVIDALNSKTPRNESNNILFSSCVASGKTKMMSQVMKRVAEEYDEDVAFIFMTLSKGGLDAQARTDLKSYGEQVVRFLTVDGLVAEASAAGKVPANTCTVIGWDTVNRDANKQMKDGEKPTFKSVMKKNKNKTKIVLFVDEAHSNLTWKSKEVKDLIHPYAIVMATATPRMKKKDFTSSEYKVIVDPDEVARAGKIKNTVIVNDGGLTGEDVLVGDYTWKGLIEAGMKRRDALEKEYRSVGMDVVPLVVVQLPNDISGTQNEKNQETASNVREAKRILVEELGYDADDDVLVWTAQEKDPGVANVVTSEHKALITKLAVSTGWDCPRAQVLVKLRKTGNDVLDIQTLGRIYRTADPTEWLVNDDYSANKMLNSAWVYCDDEDYDPSVAGLRIIDPKLEVKVRPEFRSELERIHLVRIVAGTKRILGGKSADIVEDIIAVLNDRFPYAYESGKGSWSSTDARRRVARGELEVKKMYSDLEKTGEALTGHDYIDIADEDIVEYISARVRNTSRIKRYQREVQAAIKRHTLENLYDGDVNEFGEIEDEELYEKKLQDLCRAINSAFTQDFVPSIASILDKHSDYQADMIYDGHDAAHPLWTPPMNFYSASELEKVDSDSTYVYKRIGKFDSDGERKFAREVLGKEMDVWFKNNTDTASSFCISWDKEDGSHGGFFPDFISIKGRTLYITEIKGGKDISKDNSLKPSDDKGKALAIDKWLTSKDKTTSIAACKDIDDIVFGICRLIQDDWRIYVGDGTDYEDTTNLEAWRLFADVMAEHAAEDDAE